MEPVILHETDVHGTAYSAVAPGYQGACRMEYEQSGTPRNVVFPTVADAQAAACFAVGYLGGYLKATIFAAPEATPTHETWTDWAF